MHFRQEISFKSALETFTPVSGHLRTALNVISIQISYCKFIVASDSISLENFHCLAEASFNDKYFS